MISNAIFGLSLGLDSLLNRSSNTWQIVDAESGMSAVSFTSMLSCDVRDESTIVEGPVEEGSFASYNKTHKPLEVKTTLGIMGTDSDLKDALDTIKGLRESIKLVNFVTPDAEYESLNIESYNYSQKAELGRGVLYVDLVLKEVRQVKAEYSNEKIPNQKKSGKKQATDKGQNNRSIINATTGIKG